MSIKATTKEIYEAPAVEVVELKMDSVILQMSVEDYEYVDLNG